MNGFAKQHVAAQPIMWLYVPAQCDSSLHSADESRVLQAVRLMLMHIYHVRTVDSGARRYCCTPPGLLN